ncbi:MAG: ATP-dependent DNA helicase RecG, partial [Clostridia bacterium]|nr:ATP-dependent DNA helicase RecG [Clostridia bacterium]
FATEGLFDFCVKAALFSEQNKKGRVAPFADVPLNDFLSRLPFRLTGAQKRVLEEIRGDLVGETDVAPMNRLIQGDVGSGKTVVAAAAAYLTAKNRRSTLFMAPTEILARQHYASLTKLFSHTDVPVFLLTGSTPKKEREAIFSATTTKIPYVLVGTHALTEEGARCENVALAITDEQHRFGVRQRNLLGEKGGAVHSLVMSATPIPRSLAMFLYAKGSISVIDELPPGRQRVETLYVGEDKLPRIYGFLKDTVAKGHQAYIVCPLICDEEGESPLQSAEEEYAEIQKALPGIECALLHGKMKNEEKNRVMESFQSGETKILVSTTVIEVGVDVPNATVMVIRNAERFGLSQLHQLRGRVGRGKEKSFCVLVSSHSGQTARERLRKLCDCHDGFELAEFDLKTRGPGEFFGTRQSGFGGMDLSDAISTPLLARVTEAAREFIRISPPEALRAYEMQTRLN